MTRRYDIDGLRIAAVLILLPVVVLVLSWLVMEDDQSGQPPFAFIFVFLLGFLLVADERIYHTIAHHWLWILCIGVVASVAFIWA